MQHEALYLCPDFISLFAGSREAWYELEAALLSAAPFSLYLVSFRKKNDSFVEGRVFIASDIVATP
jgi:hypothetical protein